MERTLKETIDAQALQRGTDVFLQSCEGEQLSFAGLQRECIRLGEALVKRGVKKGDRIILFLENGIPFGVGFFGTVYNGFVAVPVNAAYKKRELEYVNQDSGASYLLTSRGLYDRNKELFAQLEGRMVELEVQGLLLFALPQEAEDREAPAAVQQDLALLLYTSGSTGRPKGVMLTHRNLLAEASHIALAHAFTDRDVTVCILPFFHINGLVITLITPLTVGMKAIVPPKFSASKFWDWVETYRVSWFSAVPTIYSILLSRAKEGAKDHSSLRFARSASAALPVAVLREFEERYQVPIIESFGISEGGSQITTNPLPPKARKPGSVGLGYGNEVVIIKENGERAEPYEEGEIVIRGDNIAAGYWRKPEAPREAFVDGWFHSGDLGYLDEEGYLFIRGRKKELINRAGEKFSPREIDEVLYQLPEIALAAAVGVPNPLYNEEVVAYVQLKEGQTLTAAQIQRHCKTKLADFKVPKEIFFTDVFPKGPSGKIQRLKLIERYQRETLSHGR